MSEIKKLLESLDAIDAVAPTEPLKEAGINEIEEFEELMGEIRQLIDQAYGLLPRGGIEQRRAESYWYNTMKGCIDGQATMHSMADSLQELSDASDEDPYDADHSNGDWVTDKNADERYGPQG